jgi:hypothetical protein
MTHQDPVLPGKMPLFVFYGPGQWRPYKGYWPAPTTPLFQAVALPGGFTGFGQMADAAMKMAHDRAIASMKRAKAFANVSSHDWWRVMWNKINPHARAAIEVLASTLPTQSNSTNHPDPDDDGLDVQSKAVGNFDQVGRLVHQGAMTGDGAARSE